MQLSFVAGNIWQRSSRGGGGNSGGFGVRRPDKCVTVCLFPSRRPLSVQAVLGGGGVRGGGVIVQGAPAARARPTLQQVLQLHGHAARERCVDPRVGARVEAGEQHQDGEGHSCTNTRAPT